MKKIISLLAIFLFLLNPLQIFGETHNNQIDITTKPGKILFNLSNVKPGDSVIRNLEITNNGGQDFNYITTSKFLSGSKTFYNQLDLLILDKNGVLFKGKLTQFIELAPRLLKSKQNEDLLLKIKIPLELGNEYQGLDTEFQLKFYVEGTLGGILPATGPKLPETGTNMFNYLAAGAVLLLGGLFLQFFHLKRKKLDKKV